MYITKAVAAEKQKQRLRLENISQGFSVTLVKLHRVKKSKLSLGASREDNRV